MIYYIEDEQGDVVGQFDGVSMDLKEAHTQVEVDALDGLPGVDRWDPKYKTD